MSDLEIPDSWTDKLFESGQARNMMDGMWVHYVGLEEIVHKAIATELRRLGGRMCDDDRINVHHRANELDPK